MLSISIFIISIVFISVNIIFIIVNIYSGYKERFIGMNIWNDDFEDRVINSTQMNVNYNSVNFFIKIINSLLRILIKKINKYYRLIKNYILFFLLKIIDIFYYLMSRLSNKSADFISKQYDESLGIKKFDSYLKVVKEEAEVIEKIEEKEKKIIKQKEN